MTPSNNTKGKLWLKQSSLSTSLTKSSLSEESQFLKVDYCPTQQTLVRLLLQNGEREFERQTQGQQLRKEIKQPGLNPVLGYTSASLLIFQLSYTRVTEYQMWPSCLQNSNRLIQSKVVHLTMLSFELQNLYYKFGYFVSLLLTKCVYTFSHSHLEKKELKLRLSIGVFAI